MIRPIRFVLGEYGRRQLRSHRYAVRRVISCMSASTRHVWAALVIVYFVWGSTYLGIKVAVDTLPPLFSAGSRFLAAGAILALVLAASGHGLRITRRELASTALLGALLLTLGVGVVHLAETRMTRASRR